MSEFSSTYIEKNSERLLKYKVYLQNNNWEDMSVEASMDDSFFNDLYSEDPTKVKKAEISKMMKEVFNKQKDTMKAKSDEHKLQLGLTNYVFERLKKFINKTRGEHHIEENKNFIEFCLDIINIHVSRVEDYLISVDITQIENQDIRSEEISLMKESESGVNKIEEQIQALNIQIEETSETSGIEFLNNVKAPLSMHKVLSEIYPEIGKKLDEMGIDFESDPGNELHIYNQNAPKWNIEKHYWEQEKETLQYYVNEFKKLENGIVIDGYYISGWMYYHMNIFVTPIPHKVWNDKSKQFESKDKIINPPLRDSDVNIFENYENAKRQSILITFICATRRAAKTTLESSKLGHAATIGRKELLCAGGSTKDLNQIAKNFKTDIQYKNSAFAVYNVTNDWKDKIELGLKTKANKTILLSTLYIVNTDGGNNSEILAGFTPDEFVYDEALKNSFIEPLEGLKPALKGTDGLIRCYCIISATGGDDALSKDGLTVLNDPVGNDVLPMDWDLLERGVPEEYKTWKEDKQKPFGTFIPGQMCVDMPKIESTLAEYLNLPNAKGLKQIKIKVTDWENATKQIEETRERKKGNKVAYMKEIVYIPIKPSEIFMSGKQNPFPVNEAKAHKQYLLDSGLWDRRRELFRDSHGKVQSRISKKPLVEYPHKGGIIDAPALIFEDFPEVKPKFGTYTAGFDATKQDDSATNSVLTFYVMKNRILGDPFSEKIVASISFRPEKKEMAYEQWLMLMEAYGLDGTCFGENEDYTIKDYLDKFKLADKYLAQSLDFSQTFNIPNNLKRKTGWNPSTTKKTLHGLFVDYCNEVMEVEQENGVKIILKGVQKIDDIGLLDEIIGWTEHANTDRLVAAYGAYGFLHYLNSSYIWKVEQKKEEDEKPKEYKPHTKKIFGGSTHRRSALR